ncbi:Leucine-rich repeat receptor-like protein kinase PXC1 [Hibiscus syriacus]|uniref:Leucine-rich repeat receptor-like protein kinase PXC1 n=1 Tax=Hibiscus syriacus TaxID=106335 RepID=A0A6A2X6S0_HIBSY|nr:Leucine-rich repeat receptor-like protein kinase PXC1 [Hibiscus syriacus]
MKPPPFFLLSTLFLSLLTLSFSNDTDALTLFRHEADTHVSLNSNWTGRDSCSSAWLGVVCTSTGRVTALSLPSLSLRGPVTSLSLLNQLRILDVQENRFNGTVSPLTNCSNLKLIYLSDNDLSGDIPPQISLLKRLLRLDLSNNNIRGNIPQEISGLKRLITLRLQNNALACQIPDFSSSLGNLKELNLTNNEFFGRLPGNLLKKVSTGGFIDPDRFIEPERTPIIEQYKISYFCGRNSGEIVWKAGSDGGKRSGSEKKVYANGGAEPDSDGTNGTYRSKLVSFERGKQFVLVDLLRASAEMLGKGSLGTVYKAVLDDGCTVTVKGLKDANPCPRKEFEQYMDVIGKVHHPNVVKLRAYYYAEEEKLLVYDYLPNGTLHSVLHGNRGPGRIPLDWTTRISLVLGAARGLTKIHEEYSAPKIPHGNVKSSDVLLDKNGVALISDFGLALLLNPAHAIARLGGYRAPEQAEPEKRPSMAEVAKMIEDIKVEQSPLGEDYDESRNSASPSIATTEDGLAGY